MAIHTPTYMYIHSYNNLFMALYCYKKNQRMKVIKKNASAVKGYSWGFFFLFNYQIHPNQVAMFPNQSTHSECNRKIGVVYMYVM